MPAEGGQRLQATAPEAPNAPATIRGPVRTAIVSDLHLGSLSGADVARRPRARERLLEALAAADRVVLLGDALELREGPLADALQRAQPFFEALGEVVAGRRVVLAAGNHDHPLAEPWLTRLRLEGRELGSENEWPVRPGDAHGPAGRVAAWMPRVELTLAYPGLRLRPDVYATHGHYVDLDLTMPRLESIAASALGRIGGRGRDRASAADYEAVMSPLYAFLDRLAQGSPAGATARSGSLSRSVWGQVTGRRTLRGLLLGRVTIPGAVLALNRLGLGPYTAVLTGEELRRSGLVAMARVAGALAPDADHVLFGHTHRPGPLPGDHEAEWATLSGARLWNTGSWYQEGALLGGAGEASPYWPGMITWLEDSGPPRIENLLRGVALD